MGIYGFMIIAVSWVQSFSFAFEKILETDDGNGCTDGDGNEECSTAHVKVGVPAVAQWDQW